MKQTYMFDEIGKYKKQDGTLVILYFSFNGEKVICLNGENDACKLVFHNSLLEATNAFLNEIKGDFVADSIAKEHLAETLFKNPEFKKTFLIEIKRSMDSDMLFLMLEKALGEK